MVEQKGARSRYLTDERQRRLQVQRLASWARKEKQRGEQELQPVEVAPAESVITLPSQEENVREPVHRRARGGRSSYFTQVPALPLLGVREAEVARKKDAGDEEARKEFIEGNLRYVLSIARSYNGRGLSYKDLVSAGNEGLILAVDKFEVERGFKFSTFAQFYIRAKMREALADEAHPFPLPYNKYNSLFKFDRVQANQRSKVGREPSHEEIAQEMGDEPSEVAELKQLSQIEMVSWHEPVETLEPTEITPETPLPLTLQEITPSPNPSVEEEVIFSDQREKIIKGLRALTPKEERILKLRFGLEGGEEMTLEETGQVFGVSRERIRQIELHAIRKLRRNQSYRALFEEYTPNP
jgi:RNA polymerase primary sigma factor